MEDIVIQKENETPHLTITVVKIVVGADNQTKLTSNSVTTIEHMLKKPAIWHEHVKLPQKPINK